MNDTTTRPRETNLRVAGRRSSADVPRRFRNILCLDDFEEPARRFLPRPIFGFAERPRMARESGVDGILVSNHGGRQLDYTVAPLRVLPAVVAEAGNMTIMMDGGVRRGTDVLKALALGAKFVFIGRPFLYAAAIAGAAGVHHAASILKDEISRDMAMLGISSLAEMKRELLVPARGPI
jgi:hypothetical protein